MLRLVAQAKQELAKQEDKREIVASPSRPAAMAEGVVGLIVGLPPGRLVATYGHRQDLSFNVKAYRLRLENDVGERHDRPARKLPAVRRPRPHILHTQAQSDLALLLLARHVDIPFVRVANAPLRPLRRQVRLVRVVVAVRRRPA